MIEAELPDGTVLEFPDGTPREVVQRTVHARLQSAQSTPTPAPTPAAPAKTAPAAFQRAGQGSAAATAAAVARKTSATHPLLGAMRFLALRAGLDEDAATSGFADAGVRGYLGVKTLFGGLDKEEQGVLREQEAEAKADPSGGSRTSGAVMGNVLLSAVPASKAAGIVSKGAAIVPKVLAPAATAAAVSGGQGIVLNPGHGDTFEEQVRDKLYQSGKDAAYGGLFTLGGQAGMKAATGLFKPSMDAIRLFKEGVTPTLQQGAAGLPGKYIGGLTSGAFDISRRQQREIENALLKRITGGQTIPHATRREAVNIADDVMERAYTDFARGRRVPISPSLRGNMARTVDVTTPTGQFGEEAASAQAALANIMPDYPRNINVGYRKLQNDYLHPLSEAAGAQRTERAKQALLSARELLIKARNSRLTPDELQQLKSLDIRNYDFNRLREAASGPGKEREGISLFELERAYSAAPPMAGHTTTDELIGPASRTIAQRPMQELARTFLINAKRAAALGIGATAATGSPLAIALAPLYGTSLIGQSKWGAKALFGQYEAQKKLAEALKKMAPYFAGSGQSLTPELEGEY